MATDTSQARQAGTSIPPSQGGATSVLMLSEEDPWLTAWGLAPSEGAFMKTATEPSCVQSTIRAPTMHRGGFGLHQLERRVSLGELVEADAGVQLPRDI